jgi:transcriptional regulator with PAS, ATPase and Fis domain
MAHREGDWIKEFPVAVTVTDEKGILVEMNDASCRVNAAEGGASLIGSNVLDCHPEPARTQTARLFETKLPNHYTIRKKGQKKIIHQIPWTKDGIFAGFVELSIAIPDELPHFDRE